VVLVRKSGPVQSMKFRSWWIYFLFLVLIVMLAGLVAASYLLFNQQQALKDLSEDTRLLMLRAERLESLAQEQETRALLAQQAEDEKREAEQAAKAKNAAKEVVASEKLKAEEAKPDKPALPPEPKSSEHVTINNVEINKKGGEVNVVFDVVNQHDPADPAMGYVTVINRAERAGKPWIEAWPPMRLSPLGRPLNYRRGTPFSVQRYRRLKASFAKGDKKFERLEFLIYSREGELMLAHTENLAAQGEKSSTQEPTGSQ